jgi:hypothetical protein
MVRILTVADLATKRFRFLVSEIINQVINRQRDAGQKFTADEENSRKESVPAPLRGASMAVLRTQHF